jgi:hypothetical protein
MGFIIRTRLVQIAIGALDSKTMLTPPVVFVTSGLGVAVETVPEAMALVPPGSRPPVGEWWQYMTQWQVTACILPTVRGAIPYTMADQIVYLIVDADFWLTAADQANSLPPILKNTFTFGFNQRPRDYLATVRQSVEEYLVRATWHNWTGDQRDMRIVASKQAADDPRGLLSAVSAYDGVIRNLNSIWVGK